MLLYELLFEVVGNGSSSLELLALVIGVHPVDNTGLAVLSVADAVELAVELWA